MSLEKKLKKLDPQITHILPIISSQEPQKVVIDILKLLRNTHTGISKIEIIHGINAIGSKDYSSLTDYLNYMLNSGLINVEKKHQHYNILITDKGQDIHLDELEFISLGRQDGQLTQIMKEWRIAYVLSQYKEGALMSRLSKDTSMGYAEILLNLSNMIQEEYLTKVKISRDEKNFEAYKLSTKGMEKFQPYFNNSS